MHHAQLLAKHCSCFGLSARLLQQRPLHSKNGGFELTNKGTHTSLWRCIARSLHALSLQGFMPHAPKPSHKTFLSEAHFCRPKLANHSMCRLLIVGLYSLAWHRLSLCNDVQAPPNAAPSPAASAAFPAAAQGLVGHHEAALLSEAEALSSSSSSSSSSEDDVRHLAMYCRRDRDMRAPVKSAVVGRSWSDTALRYRWPDSSLNFQHLVASA